MSGIVVNSEFTKPLQSFFFHRGYFLQLIHCLLRENLLNTLQKKYIPNKKSEQDLGLKCSAWEVFGYR